MVAPLSLASQVSVIQGLTFLCLKPEHSVHPRALYWIPLSRRVKHFRWDPRHLSLQPNTYQDFNRKCWRCHHTHPISQGPGLPGNRFTWSHLLGFGTYIAHSEKQLEMVGQGRRLTSPMSAQPAKSVSKNRYKHNHRWSIEGTASFVTLFISYTWEGAEPCRFSTISEQRQGCFLGCWRALQLVKISQWKTFLFKSIEGSIKDFSLEYKHLRCM